MVSAPAPPAVTRRYVPALTGLRAVAAYAVFLHHYNPAPAHTFAHRLFDQGYTGVSLFFVLSGFLIYHRYAGSFYVRTDWSWRRFVRNRFARIVPLYGLLFLLTLIAGLFRNRPMDWTTLVLNLTLLKGLLPAYAFSGLPQSWSLTVELCFYVLAPGLIWAMRRWGAGCLTIALMGAGLVSGLLARQLSGDAEIQTMAFVSFYTFFGRSFEFVVGMVLAHQWHRGSWPHLGHGLVVGGLLIIACVLEQATAPIGSPVAAYIRELIAYNYILPVGLGLVLWHLLHGSSWLNRVLSQPLSQALGRSSYAFYLIHLGVIPKLLDRAGLVPNRWVLFGLLVLLAHGLYIGVEQPILRRLRA